MIRRFLRSKLYSNVDNLDFLKNNYLNKSLLYYQAINYDANSYYKSINEKRNLKTKIYYLTKYSYSAEHSTGYSKLGSIELARQFINSLTIEERNIIKNQIIEVEKEAALNVNKEIQRPTWRQLSIVALQSGLPFIGFGFVDNSLMLIAGDFIESWIGTMVPISTMAAAGLGNAVSDVVGISIAHHIEAFSLKFVKVPPITSEQWELSIVTWVAALAKSIFIFIGCVIGMSPLLFMKNDKNGDDNDEKKKKSSETK